jgi:hypothetical protein
MSAARQNNPSSAPDGRTPYLVQYSDSAQPSNHPKYSGALAAAAALCPPSPSAVAHFNGSSTTSRRMMHYRHLIIQVASLKWKEKEETKVIEHHCWRQKNTTKK